jgi:pyruvate dehydrogenase E1 component
MQYMRERREALGGFVPQRRTRRKFQRSPRAVTFERAAGRQRRPRNLHHHGLRAHPERSWSRTRDRPRIVPIVPDEARTFGMEGMFRQLGIYSSVGQLYEPVDATR